MRIRKFFSNLNPRVVYFSGCLLLAVGIPCDGFLRSFETMGMILMLAACIFSFSKSSIKNSLFKGFGLLFGLMYLFILVDFFRANSLDEWSKKALLKLPFLLFPLIFAPREFLTEAKVRLVLITFIFVTAFISLLSVLNYLAHFKEINILVSQSKPVPIIGGTMHIYFSVMMAFGILAGCWLLRSHGGWNFRSVLQKMIAGATLTLLIALHILSARTGLVAFYTAAFALLLIYCIQNKKFRLLIGGLALMLIMPPLFYFAVPSVKNRVRNSMDDMDRYFNNKFMDYYSISSRFVTWNASVKIIAKHPVTGVGTGNETIALQKQYVDDKINLSKENLLENAHNQYLQNALSNGIPGLILLLIVLTWPFFEKANKQNYVYLAHVFIFISACLVECMFERQAGLYQFLFFSFLLRRLNDQ